jgi:hypothetical protein
MYFAQSTAFRSKLKAKVAGEAAQPDGVRLKLLTAGCAGLPGNSLGSHTRSSVSAMKPDLPVVFGVGGSRELADGFDDPGELFVMNANAGIKFGQLFGESLLVEHKAAERSEGADHDQAHLDCAGAVEDSGSHEGAVIGEGEWMVTPATPTKV